MPKRTVSKKTDESGQALSFEEALRRLEEIVNQLEAGDAPLDSALKLYEEGVKLSRVCSQQLKEAERRVEILEDKNGEMRAKPFLDKARREELGLEPETESDEDAESGDENEEVEEEDEDGDESEDEDEDEDLGRPSGRKPQETLF